MRTTEYRDQLKRIMDKYVHLIYKISKKFPQDELYGATTQIRRATLSIILNYIEGYARRKIAVQLNFLETSYGSLKESKYLLYFAKTENWITTFDYEQALKLAEEIGAMLWTAIVSLDKELKKPS